MLVLARSFLERKGLGEARLDAELLVAHALGIDRLQLFLRLDQPLQGTEVDRARDLLVRRGRREPTAYVVGSREFYGRDFRVGAGVLVPRPETELLVDLVREWAAEREGAPRVCDVGTGSGCVAVTLALELEGAEVVAVDVSEEALHWARGNAEALGAEVRFVHGEGLESLEAAARQSGPFDVVVSNPPYVEPDERDDLAPEVREHEPALALYAPPGDPDHWVRSLVERAAETVAPGGLLAVELGHRQAARVLALAQGAGDARLIDDLAGIPRVLELRR
ncbi:MAG: peptide chain release factor N(5)-glutamine methyltransferase [Planctomycetota bacterium]